MRIERGKGVCGTAAERMEPMVVADVRAFPGHIACDSRSRSRSRSEVVVPIVHDGVLRALLDIDSDALDAFDESDRDGLVKIASQLAALV